MALIFLTLKYHGILPSSNDHILYKLISEIKKLSSGANLRLSETIWSEDIKIPEYYQEIVKENERMVSY